MSKRTRSLLSLLLALFMVFSMAACKSNNNGGSNGGTVIPNTSEPSGGPEKEDDKNDRIEKRDSEGNVCEDGWYYCAEDVCEYMLAFGKLPSNFVTKNEAKDAGWTGGSVEKYIEGAAIGGNAYENDEKLLPEKEGRTYHYCDLDTLGQSSRGAKRLVYSNDGLFYVTEDSYKSFFLLYGEPDEEPADPEQGDNKQDNDKDKEKDKDEGIKVNENGTYYDKEHVALYIHTYGKLPSNFVTKNEAKDAGWNGGSVEKYIKNAAIGGSQFSNSEGILPKKKGRQYYECDIDTHGEKTRGAKRIVYSDDGLIYYTEDHYESFELLYGEEQ